MLSRTHSRSRLLVTCVLAGVGAACGARASVISYDFTANTADVQTSTFIGGSYGGQEVQDDFSLINTATGLNSVPAITLYDGDTVNGTVSLSNPWTVSPNTINGGFLNITLQSMDNNPTAGMHVDESLSFFDNGVQVSVPAGFDTAFDTGGALVIGMGVSGTPTSGFTFDQIDFSATMTDAYNISFQPINPAPLNASSPTLSILTSPPPAAAPELDPASLGGALTLLVGALAVARGRRARVSEA